MGKDEELFLEINGANSSSKVSLNGKELACHDGGYSTYRVKLTEDLQDENELQIEVDNSANDHVYPQKADFTFYGGLYRDVKLIIVPKTHFDLEYFGGKGLYVTPEVFDGQAIVKLDAYIRGNADKVMVSIDGVGEVKLEVPQQHEQTLYDEDAMKKCHTFFRNNYN